MPWSTVNYTVDEHGALHELPSTPVEKILICNCLRSVNLYLEQMAAMPRQSHFQDAWLDHLQYRCTEARWYVEKDFRG